MSVGSPTAGTWSSSQWRLDNEFETDRQARWVSGADVRRQIQFINNLFEVAA